MDNEFRQVLPSRLREHKDRINAIAFAPASSTSLFSASSDSTVCMWDLNSPATPVITLSLPGEVTAMAVGLDGSLVAAAFESTLQFYDIRQVGSYLHSYRHIHSYVYTCTYIHINTHTYIHTHILTHTYTCIHMHTQMYIYIHTQTYIYIHTYIHTFIHTYTYIHSFTHIHTYTYIHIYTYIYIHTHTYSLLSDVGCL